MGGTVNSSLHQPGIFSGWNYLKYLEMGWFWIYLHISTTFYIRCFMGLLDFIFGPGEIDDVSVLPGYLQTVYQNPHRTLGLEDNATVNQIRDSFRKSSICFVSAFSGMHHPKVTLQQLVLAYHLCRKTVTGPAKKLLMELNSSPYLTDVRPDDILPLLRPVHSSFKCPPEFRGFRKLTILCTDFRTLATSVTVPRTVFKFDIHYCMRRHTIEACNI